MLLSRAWRHRLGCAVSGHSPSRIHRRRRTLNQGSVVEEFVTVEVPHGVAETPQNLAWKARGDTTTLGEVEILIAARRNPSAHGGLVSLCRRTRWLAIWCQLGHGRTSSLHPSW